MVLGTAISGLAAGAGSAINGLATLLTAEVATINIEHTPKKTKRISGEAKLNAAIKISPLSIFFGIDVLNYAKTGKWSFSLLEIILGGLPGTITEGFDTVTESQGVIEQYTSDPFPLLRWGTFTEEQRDNIVREITQREIEVSELERQAKLFDEEYLKTGDPAYTKQATSFRRVAAKYKSEIQQIRDMPLEFFAKNPKIFETIP